MNFLWKVEEMQTTEKENDIFNKLSLHLKEQILLQTYGKLLFQIPLFKNNFSKQFITRVLSLMKPVYFDPNSIIYKVLIFFLSKFMTLILQQGDTDNIGLFIIDKGQIGLYQSKKDCVPAQSQVNTLEVYFLYYHYIIIIH